MHLHNQPPSGKPIDLDFVLNYSRPNSIRDARIERENKPVIKESKAKKVDFTPKDQEIIKRLIPLRRSRGGSYHIAARLTGTYINDGTGKPYSQGYLSTRIKEFAILQGVYG